MPKFSNVLETQTTPSGLRFSAVGLGDLKENEYVLVTIVVDTSGSVADHVPAIETCLQELIKGCHKSPKRNSLLVRVIAFGTQVTEIHGFKPLSTIDADDYHKVLGASGSTAMYQAVLNAIESAVKFGQQLQAQTITAASAIYVIGDGGDRMGVVTPKQILKANKLAKLAENLESSQLVFIHFENPDEPAAAVETERFVREAELTQHVDMGAATPAKMAHLGGLISRSVSTVSATIGAGPTPAGVTVPPPIPANAFTV